MFNLESEGFRWGITFLQTDMQLDEEDRMDLVAEATVMYLLKKDRKDVSRENYDARISSTGKYGYVGNFGGYRFNADIETNDGKGRLSFLVTEPVDPELN
jgi:hypothetical protein